jgi:hypothetical protein
MANGTEPSAEDIALAEELLAEWDEGRGASKSDLERRVWNDGGAHGRHFDRFVRQILGVATTHPSKQTDRIEVLEGQLRRLGVVPEGTELEEWESQLHHGRHAALSGLRAWNDPTGSFRTQNFAVLFVIAWNSIALALLQRAGREWQELDDEGQPKLIDGREKAQETGELVASALPGVRHLGLRRNVEFWISLRNQVAHRHLPALDTVVIPQAQAGLLNLEAVLEESFGTDYLLGEFLSVPLQLSGFRDPGVLASVKKLQAGLPFDVQTFLAQQAQVNEHLVDDPTYMLRVTFLPTVPTSGRNPDVVAYFVKPGEVSEELGLALREYLVLPKVISPPRPNLIATQVVKAVRDQIPYKFNISMHTVASRNLKARPTKGAAEETATDPRYCEYVTSVKRHLYNRAWIDRLVVELSTSDGFRTATGREPQPRD